MKKTGMVICDSGSSFYNLKYVDIIDLGLGWKDENGHGSQIMSLIHKCDESAKITSIKILDRNKECYLEDLLKALQICLELEEQIICLPLSVSGEINNIELSSMIDKLYKNEKIVISSLHNRMNYSIPAGLPNVIGVRINNINDKINKFYLKKREIQCNLPIVPIISESLDNQFSFLGGNSLACAFFTSHVLQLLQKNNEIQYDKVENICENQFVNDLYFMKFFNKDIIYNEVNYNEIYNKIKKINKKVGIIGSPSPLYNELKDINHLSEYICALQNEGLKINKNNFLKIDNLISIDSLTKYFCLEEDGNEGKI